METHATAEWDTIEIGQRIGPYRLVREIGRGGMARVYLAERADQQFEQQVALKLLRLGRTTREGLERFQRERQIVASLNHPAIARLYDGGLSEDGRPYFAMEYVDGQPIDEYCDAHRLTIPERLRLFQVVGRAVHYAHGNLLVHRDLKPANILVTDDRQVKLLDFGIAKLLDEKSGTALTRTGSFWMTPQYASPEQIRGKAITTASDQYQLGLLLYELLTGCGPYPLDRAKSFVDVAEAITRREPMRPSAVAGRLARDESEARGAAPGQLRRLLRGDLDTIVLKAVRKEPEHRYASVERLVEDVERYLKGRPVEARSGSLTYRARKFLRRHRWGAAAAAAFLVLLVGYAATVTLQSQRIAEERDRAQAAAERAEKVKTFLVEIFESADPSENPGAEITARQLLDRGAARIDEEFQSDGEVAVEMLHVIGKTYTRLGDYSRAEPLLERALDIHRELFGLENAEGAQLLNDQAMLYRFQGDYAASETANRQALEIRRRLFGDHHSKLAGSIHNLARVIEMQGRYHEAEDLYRQALDMDRRLSGDDWNRDVSFDLNSLGELLVKLGRYQEAEECFRRALEIRRQVFGEVHAAVARCLRQLAMIELHAGDLEEAESLARRALEMERQTLSVDTHYVAQALDALGLVLLARSKLEEARSCFLEALEIHDQLVGGEHRLAALARSHLAELDAVLGDHGAAVAHYEQALETMTRQVPMDHPEVADIRVGLARSLVALGRDDDARSELRLALEVRRMVFGDDHAQTREVMRALGDGA